MSSVSQAGGGAPSSAAYTHQIPSFTPAVHSHLEKAFKAICKQCTCGGADGLDRGTVSYFLRRIQDEDTPNAAEYFPEAVNGLSSFLGYMSSSIASATAEPKNRDLSHPMSSYYISSSHNTYLTGNQLYSEASTASYTNVLLRGCRCLEIDVWNGESNATSSASSSDADEKEGDQLSPGRRTLRSRVPGQSDSIEHQKMPTSNPRSSRFSPIPQTAVVAAPSTDAAEMPAPWKIASTEEKPEPRVLHGYTLTKEVSFRAVCNAIRDSAFIATDLPIIVSLEVHADLDQQEVMVGIIKEAWKGMLVDISDASEGQLDQLPSPDTLRRKILIKVKWTPATGGQDSNFPQDQVTSAFPTDDGNARDGEKAKKSSKILQALSQLGVYTRAYTFKHFNQPEASVPTHVFSLSEAKVVDMHQSNGHALFSHNRHHLMRAYPSGMRVNSSNLEPLFLWSQGVQMAALNWQKWDKGMMLNEGMFAGEEGWVLKPEGYRGTSKDRAVQTHTLSLEIELCAGQNLPLPSDEKVATKFHPYVKCELLRGNQNAKSEESLSHEKYKWVSKASKGTDPDYHGAVFQFSNVPNVVEELSFIR